MPPGSMRAYSSSSSFEASCSARCKRAVGLQPIPWNSMKSSSSPAVSPRNSRNSASGGSGGGSAASAGPASKDAATESRATHASAHAVRISARPPRRRSRGPRRACRSHRRRHQVEILERADRRFDLRRRGHGSPRVATASRPRAQPPQRLPGSTATGPANAATAAILRAPPLRARASRWRVAASSDSTLSSNAARLLRSSSCTVPRSFLPLPERPVERLHGPKIMCLHAAFRTAHRERRLCDVQALEIPEQERLALAVADARRATPRCARGAPRLRAPRPAGRADRPRIRTDPPPLPRSPGPATRPSRRAALSGGAGSR